ncbi:unnamed protein product, partial [Prorocentrum cordatum]
EDEEDNPEEHEDVSVESAATIEDLRESLFEKARPGQDRLFRMVDRSFGGIQRALDRRTALLESRHEKKRVQQHQADDIRPVEDELQRRQQETDKMLTKNSADLAQMQRKLGAAAAAGAPQPPKAGPAWSREIDSAALAVTSKRPLTRAAVAQAMAPALADAQLADVSRAEGEDLGQRFMVRMAGGAGLAGRGVRELAASFRGGGPAGARRQVSATTPTGHDAQLSLSQDKTSRKVTHEIALTQMRHALEEGLSERIFVVPFGPGQPEDALPAAWQPLVKIAIEGP